MGKTRGWKKRSARKSQGAKRSKWYRPAKSGRPSRKATNAPMGKGSQQVFRELRASAKEALEIAQGKRKPARVTKVESRG